MENEHENLTRWFCGNNEAVRFVRDVAYVTQVWDDLIDRDRPVTPERINSAFERLLIGVPRNGFYREFMAELQPLIEQMVVDWYTANSMELGSKQDQMAAWMLRDSFTAVVVRVAILCGGWAWGVEQSVEIRRAVHDEPFDEYVASIRLAGGGDG